jgi:hypothetical protein
MGHSVDTYKPLDRGEAFGEQFITITHIFLLRLLRPYCMHFLTFLSNSFTRLAL